MNTGKIIPFGYADGGVPTLERLMQDERAVLVDIRMSARSYLPAFNKDRLQARWRKRYIHMPELGNLNYNNDEPIKLANPGRGLLRLVNGLERGYTLVLMCGCKDYESCHRRTVVDLLLAADPSRHVEMPDVASPEGTLKCLSIQQPWAWLIVHGHKNIENREWTTSYRGPILIHASLKLDTNWFTSLGQLDDHPMRDLAPLDMPERQTDYPTKSIVGIATLVDVVTASDSPWFVGRYGFVFIDAKPLEPIAYSGALKLFDVPREVIAEAKI